MGALWSRFRASPPDYPREIIPVRSLAPTACKLRVSEPRIAGKEKAGVFADFGPTAPLLSFGQHPQKASVT